MARYEHDTVIETKNDGAGEKGSEPFFSSLGLLLRLELQVNDYAEYLNTYRDSIRVIPNCNKQN
ncbi:MAG TPA: hypothetical protein VK625_17465 [Flavitalea sp.]|nr:hypothetical protein [Flavitalea sp.]